MRSKTQWLDLLAQRYRAAPIQMTLDRVATVADRLALKRLPCCVITVAGTNGKGSTVRALEAMYLAAGYRVGAYSSPHLIDFNERIRLNQQMISDADLCAEFLKISEIETTEDPLSYFEFVTMAALNFFKDASLDVLILEVGLGGRLDATNVTEPDVAVITTIDFDHQAYLGNTLEAIGTEKAGILRSGIPFVFASRSRPATIAAQALALEAACYYLGEHYDYELHESQLVFRTQQSLCSLTYPLLHPDAISAALMVSEILQKRYPVDETAKKGLSQVSLSGRLQRLSEDILIDVAHNPQSVRRLSEYLQRHFSDRRIHAVFSALRDKPIREMVTELSAQVSCWHIAGLEHADRGCELAFLKKTLGDLPDLSILWYNDVMTAFCGAQAQKKAGDLIVVFGSFVTAGLVLSQALDQPIS